jgi:2-C-methyl-D-erythritol 4-phosphate cytidylyltransferase
LASSDKSDVGVILAAGGRGRRFGRRLPKQFLKLGGKTVLQWSLERFSRLRSVREIIVVVPEEHIARAVRIIRRTGMRKVHAVVRGGPERQESVANGLRALSRDSRIVLVHDAARPLVSPEIVRRVIAGARRYGAAMAGVPVSDTIKREGRAGFSTETLRRDLLWAAQTPQGFRRAILERAHRRAEEEGVLGTDEASLLERMGIPVRIVQGSSRNVKITGEEDLSLAGWLLSRPGSR